jgi:hypothetical protein
MFRQIENFFPRLNLILSEFKKFELFDKDEYNKIKNDNFQWPGKRSLSIFETNIFLFDYVNHLMFSKNLLEPGNYDIRSFIHLRLEEDNSKDYIHKDVPWDLAALIYLSDTNLESGTYLYDENKNIINDIKFVNNRIILYSGDYYHKGYGHHGSSVEDGRLTYNMFIKKV